jgi:hypothetical protein
VPNEKVNGIIEGVKIMVKCDKEIVQLVYSGENYA